MPLFEIPARIVVEAESAEAAQEMLLQAALIDGAGTFFDMTVAPIEDIEQIES